MGGRSSQHLHRTIIIVLTFILLRTIFALIWDVAIAGAKKDCYPFGDNIFDKWGAEVAELARCKPDRKFAIVGYKPESFLILDMGPGNEIIDQQGIDFYYYERYYEPGILLDRVEVAVAQDDGSGTPAPFAVVFIWGDDNPENNGILPLAYVPEDPNKPINSSDLHDITGIGINIGNDDGVAYRFVRFQTYPIIAVPADDELVEVDAVEGIHPLPSSTPTPTPVEIPLPTHTLTPSETSTSTVTTMPYTSTPTFTDTPQTETYAPTITLTLTDTQTTTAITTPTATSTSTSTPTATHALTKTSTPTNIPVPTATRTRRPRPTKTLTRTPFPYAPGLPRNTSTPSATKTPTASRTSTKAPAKTYTPTITLLPTIAPTLTWTFTATAIPTFTPTPSPTATYTPTSTSIPIRIRIHTGSSGKVRQKTWLEVFNEQSNIPITDIIGIILSIIIGLASIYIAIVAIVVAIIIALVTILISFAIGAGQIIVQCMPAKQRTKIWKLLDGLVKYYRESINNWLIKFGR